MISLTAPRLAKDIVKPIPIPKPSAVEARILFLEAKASARPSNKDS